MSKPTPQEIVHAYLDAIEARDFEHARTYLSDKHFTYRSPIAGFNDADAFIADIWRIGPILEGIERRKTFVDGNEVCDILDFKIRMAQLSTIPVVHWATVEGDEIASIEVFFDATAYSRMFEA